DHEKAPAPLVHSQQSGGDGRSSPPGKEGGEDSSAPAGRPQASETGEELSPRGAPRGPGGPPGVVLQLMASPALIELPCRQQIAGVFHGDRLSLLRPLRWFFGVDHQLRVPMVDQIKNLGSTSWLSLRRSISRIELVEPHAGSQADVR